MCEGTKTLPPRTLVVVGGMPGSGKTTLADRLARRYRLPRLSSDVVGRAIRSTLREAAVADHASFRAGYRVIFTLSESFLAAGASVLVDTSMGWQFQWDAVDSVVDRVDGARLVPIVLRCREVLVRERVRQRWLAGPERHGSPGTVFDQSRMRGIRAVLGPIESGSRADVALVDATGTPDVVFTEACRALEARSALPARHR